MQKIKDVVLLGSVSIDRIMNFNGSYRNLIQPDKLHVLSLSVLIDSLRHTRGGVAANIAYNLSLFGDHSTLLAAIGEDGSTYLKELSDKGIDTSHVYISQLPTSTFTVLTDQDDNQVGGFYPGAMGESDSLTLMPWYQKDPVIVISPYDPATMRRLVDQVKANKLHMIYDIGQQVSNVTEQDLRDGIGSAEIIIVNDYELEVLTARSSISLSDISARIPVVVTLGSKGSIIHFKGVDTPISVVPPQIVLDPTGAGDAYRAGFLYGYRRDWNLTKCCQLGSVAASFAIEKAGTQEHNFDKQKIGDRYKSIFKEDPWQ